MHLRLLLIGAVLFQSSGCRTAAPKIATLPVISSATDPNTEHTRLTRKTRFDGDYALYRLAQPEILPGSVEILIETVHLDTDEEIGFAEKEDGDFVAVAGQKFIAIDKKPHEWRRTTLRNDDPFRVRLWKEMTDISFGATILTIVLAPVALFVGVAIAFQVLGYKYNPWKLLFK